MTDRILSQPRSPIACQHPRAGAGVCPLTRPQGGRPTARRERGAIDFASSQGCNQLHPSRQSLTGALSSFRGAINCTPPHRIQPGDLTKAPPACRKRIHSTSRRPDHGRRSSRRLLPTLPSARPHGVPSMEPRREAFLDVTKGSIDRRPRASIECALRSPSASRPGPSRDTTFRDEPERVKTGRRTAGETDGIQEKG